MAAAEQSAQQNVHEPGPAAVDPRANAPPAQLSTRQRMAASATAEVARPHIAEFFHGDRKAKLTLGQEVLAGALAGIFSCWNHPFDVARIEGQARAVAGESAISMTEVFRMVHAEYGVRGLFQGIIPRALFSVNQTLFMITGAKILRDYFG